MLRPAPAALAEPRPPARTAPRAADAGPQTSLIVQALPRWALLDTKNVGREEERGFAAGAALFALHEVVRADPPWLGALRMRQALAAAAVCARLMRLREGEAGLRDAHLLTRPGDDPGPAGRLYRAWREFASRPARLEQLTLARLAHNLRLPEPLPVRLGPGKGSPIAAAAEAARAVAEQVTTDGPAEDAFGLMLADTVLAHQLGWPVPIPLLATAMSHPSLKVGPERRRPRPEDVGWLASCEAAYAFAVAAAHARAVDLARRADRMLVAAGKVRTRGGEGGMRALLNDDAVAATTLKWLGSERAARRLLERLEELGAVRELTGRRVFRLYGL